MENLDQLNALSYKIIGCAMKVHAELGPGLLETVYETCLEYELKKSGFSVERQKPIPIIYDNVIQEIAFKYDLLVENLILIEVKAVDTLAPIFTIKTLTYLKFTYIKLGLIINFNVVHLKDGIKRLIL
ncbi:MAG: GxxExxY protein [Chitinophagales bacterium]